eukprot:gene21845-biopygen7619
MGDRDGPAYVVEGTARNCECLGDSTVSSGEDGRNTEQRGNDNRRMISTAHGDVLFLWGSFSIRDVGKWSGAERPINFQRLTSAQEKERVFTTEIQLESKLPIPRFGIGIVKFQLDSGREHFCGMSSSEKGHCYQGHQGPKSKVIQ